MKPLLTFHMLTVTIDILVFIWGLFLDSFKTIMERIALFCVSFKCICITRNLKETPSAEFQMTFFYQQSKKTSNWLRHIGKSSREENLE